jgi:hypothetical protein
MEAEATRTGAAGELYARALSESERVAYEAALGVQGLDKEIGLLRMRLEQEIKASSATLEVVGRALNRLARALSVRLRLDPEAETRMEEAVTRVLKEMFELEAGDDG